MIWRRFWIGLAGHWRTWCAVIGLGLPYVAQLANSPLSLARLSRI
jgi:hypothetical protein